MLRITPMGIEILNVLWEAGEALTAKQITERSPVLKKNSVNVLVKRMMDDGYLKVDHVQYSGTVLARAYAPTMTYTEFLEAHDGDKRGETKLLKQRKVKRRLLTDTVKTILSTMDTGIRLKYWKRFWKNIKRSWNAKNRKTAGNVRRQSKRDAEGPAFKAE